jgi:hypothetical protein
VSRGFSENENGAPSTLAAPLLIDEAVPKTQLRKVRVRALPSLLLVAALVFVSVSRGDKGIVVPPRPLPLAVTALRGEIRQSNACRSADNGPSSALTEIRPGRLPGALFADPSSVIDSCTPDVAVTIW